MTQHTIASDTKYEDSYVALKSFNDNTVVAFGDQPGKVREAAIEAGVNEPVLMYVPRHDREYIY